MNKYDSNFFTVKSAVRKINFNFLTRKIAVKKLTLIFLTINLVVPAVADAGLIVLGPRCSMADAIRAANTDRKIRGCRPGRGADVILAGKRNAVPLTPYPEIRSRITISAPGSTFIRGPYGAIDYGDPVAYPPRPMFNVAKGASLEIDGAMLEIGTVNVRGRFVLRNGGIGHSLGNGINALPGSFVELDTVDINDCRYSGLKADYASVTVKNSSFRLHRTHPAIDASNSALKMSGARLTDNHVGIRYVGTHFEHTGTTMANNGSDYDAGGGSAVTSTPESFQAAPAVNSSPDEAPVSSPVPAPGLETPSTETVETPTSEETDPASEQGQNEVVPESSAETSAPESYSASPDAANDLPNPFVLTSE